MFRTAVLFGLTCHFLTNMVRVIEGKIIKKNDLKGNENCFELAGGSSSSRVRVTEGKIAINARRKSRGNRFWFELARVPVIWGRLYLVHNTILTFRSLHMLYISCKRTRQTTLYLLFHTASTK